jgi:hypothetical protein
MNKNSWKWHLVEGLVTYDFTLHSRVRDFGRCVWDGLWILSFGLSQFHGHGSWLVCEVVLRATSKFTHKAKCHDDEIVRAPKKVSKGPPNTPPTSCSVAMDPQV